MPSRRPWTPEELAHLLSQYPNTPTKDIARTLDRPIAGVYQKAQNMGLRRTK